MQVNFVFVRCSLSANATFVDLKMDLIIMVGMPLRSKLFVKCESIVVPLYPKWTF
jgi:hypothetical protein